MSLNLTTRQFRVPPPAAGQAPLFFPDFRADTDVLLIDLPTLTRADVQLTQTGANTVLRVPGAAIGQAGEWVAIAELANTQAADLDPLPLVQQFYQALNAHQVADVQALQATDCQWEVPGPTDLLHCAGRHEGPAGVADFFARFDEQFWASRWEVRQYLAQGNTVAAIVGLSGQARPGGVPFAVEGVHWVTVQDGRISRVQFYLDTFPLLEALAGGRPFRVPASESPTHYVVQPVASARTTDSLIFCLAMLDTPPTVRAVQAMYVALPHMNVLALRKLFAPNVVWQMLGTADLMSWAGERHGPEAAGESVNQIAATMHFDFVTPIRLIHQGNTAAVLLNEAGSWSATGQPFKTSVTHIVQVNEGGQVVLFRNYMNTAWIAEAALGGRPYEVLAAQESRAVPVA